MSCAKPYTVFMAFDGGFAKYAAVTLASLLAHTGADLLVECIVHEVAVEDLDCLRRVCGRLGAEISFHSADHTRFSSWKVCDHYGIANFYRLMIPELTREARVLYIDSDLVFTTDVAPLLATPLHEALIGGCPDEIGARYTTFPQVEGDTYLNTGVLLMNVDAMRACEFSLRCVELQEAHGEQLRFADQCLINRAAAGRKLILDSRWNIQQHAFEAGAIASEIERLDGRGVWHATGRTKPWMEWSDPAFSRLWFSYARLVHPDRARFLVHPRNLQELGLLGDMLEREGRWKEACEQKNLLLVQLAKRLEAGRSPG